MAVYKDLENIADFILQFLSVDGIVSFSFAQATQSVGIG